MSLVKQLWLATSFLILTAFLASLAASLISAETYYEEQLSLKNSDSAKSLAITLSHAEKEKALLQSFLEAQFATGHYQRIALAISDDQSLELKAHSQEHQAPAWFRSMFVLDVPAGVATVSDGWVNFGTLVIESDTTYAQTSLWVTAQRLFLWLSIVALLAGLAGSWLVRRISRPLKDVVEQAEAIGEKRFIVSNEPHTTEFRRVVRAMNKLSRRVETILDSEAMALAEMRQKALYDAVTGVANREFFISRLDSLIDDPETDTRHTLILVRISNLNELNAELGRERINVELRQLCETLFDTISKGDFLFGDCFIGRLNGSDFALVINGFQDIAKLSTPLATGLKGTLEPAVRLSISTFQSRTTHADVLMKADHLLAKAEQTGQKVVIDEENLDDIPFRTASEWREAICTALRNNAVRAALHPLVDRKGTTLHMEAKGRLRLNDQWRAAGFFLPWGRRLGLLSDVDTAIARHLIDSPAGPESLPVVIHIARETFLKDQSRRQILALLERQPSPARTFRLELPETVLSDGDMTLSNFVHEAQALGCGVGISGVGQNLERISRVHELGLDYLKTDPVYAQRLETDPATQQYLQRLTSLAHSIGVEVYLAGANSEGCVHTAWAVGVDGVTGPGVKPFD